MKYFILGLSILCTLNLSAQDWVQLSSLPAAAAKRHHPITFSVDGMGYIVTGGGAGFDVMGDFLRYDPIADSWETLTPFPGGERGFGYGVTIDNKAYIGFGGEAYNFYNDLWKYDPLSLIPWTQLALCPCEHRLHPALIATEDKIFVGLGAGVNGNLNDWWEYDVVTNSWSQKPDFPAAERHHPYYFSIDNIVYVGFGHGGANIYNDFYKYDPSTETWTALNDFPGQGRVAGTQFSYNGKGYIMSGQGEDHFNLDDGEFWEYDPETDSWTELDPHPGGSRWAPGNFLIDNKLYFTCGRSDFDDQKDLWMYDFSPEMTSLDETTLYESNLVLSPNPTSGELFIQSEFNFEKATIFDIHGHKINTISVNENKLELPNLANGVYFIKVFNDKISETKKVVIQR